MTIPTCIFNDVSAISYLKLVGLSDHPNFRLEVDNLRGQFFDAIREGQYISLSVRGKTSDGRGFYFVPISGKNLYLNLYFCNPDRLQSNKGNGNSYGFCGKFCSLRRTDALTKRTVKEKDSSPLTLALSPMLFFNINNIFFWFPTTLAFNSYPSNSALY